MPAVVGLALAVAADRNLVLQRHAYGGGDLRGLLEDAVPSDARVETDWRALEVAGPLDFSMVGVMASLTAPLADVDVSVFVVSTYDTDYVLVHAAALERAVEALRAAGHAVHAG